MKKDTLLRGTLILAAAALVARVLGLFQRVPLEHVLTNLGDIYYAVANNVYLFLLVVATAGIPSAVSKMVSERYALGREDEARQIYRASLLFGATAGIVITLVMFALAPVIAGPIMHEPGAAASIRAIAPSLLLFPVLAMMRGYFQGRHNMAAGGISQIVEQILRVIGAIAIAFTFAAWGWSDEKIAAGAAFGSVFGSVGAFLVMLYYGRQLSADDKSAGKGGPTPAGKMRLSRIYRELFRLSVPIVLTAVTVQLIYTLDSILFKPLLNGHFTTETINMWGSVLLQRAQALAGIPVILAIALSQSIIPVISSAHATGDEAKVGRQASLAVRIAVFSGMPIVLLMSFGAYSLNGFLFSSDEGSLIVAMLTFGTIFQIGMMVTNSILLGIGQPRKATVHSMTGILIKLILSVILTPWLGVYGLIIATSVCFVWVLGFNILSLKKRTAFTVIDRRRWLSFSAVILIMSGVIWALQSLTMAVLAGWPDKIAFFISCAIISIAVVGLYPVLIVLLNVITAKEAETYPRPVRRLLAPVFRLRRGNAAANDA